MSTNNCPDCLKPRDRFGLCPCYDPIGPKFSADERARILASSRKNHGSPVDRGRADFWYHRGRVPHCWPDGTYRGTRIAESEMTAEEVRAYHAGYDEAELEGDQKCWH